MYICDCPKRYECNKRIIADYGSIDLLNTICEKTWDVRFVTNNGTVFAERIHFINDVAVYAGLMEKAFHFELEFIIIGGEGKEIHSPRNPPNEYNENLKKYKFFYMKKFETYSNDDKAKIMAALI